jgi:hypothetical protein
MDLLKINHGKFARMVFIPYLCPVVLKFKMQGNGAKIVKRLYRANKNLTNVKIEVMKMRLTSESIAKIRHPKMRHIWPKLNELYGLTSTSKRTYDILKANEWNGKLTNAATLKFLEEHLKMTREQLLETLDD